MIAGRAINKRQAAVNRWDDIDADGQYLAGIDGVVTRIDTRARRLKLRAEQAAAPEQTELPFSLPAAVAMDLEGTTLVSTRQLTRAEFVRAIEIRHQQIANDSAALREWREALRQADQFWAENTTWRFGDCLDAILTHNGLSGPDGEVLS
ncbi:hypothetical protein [Pseudooceanicola sp.]|uniref:hypothetical protein n=1 Tax=Pseudooceanicola sp. TaxID=1914328 RepID=UPI002622FCC0|nr:hypothetical protein [Pseudooceanicola sp.]